jgi:hypothetical protein
LPDGATRIDLRSRSAFFEYAQQHTLNWYAHFNGTLGLDAENGGLYLVTGADKTANWCAAAYADGPRVAALEFAELNGQWSWQSSGIVDGRTAIPPLEDGRRDQCVFVRGYRVALNKRLFSKRYVGPGGTYNAEQNSPLSYLFPGWLIRTIGEWLGYSHSHDENESCVKVEMFPALTEVGIVLSHERRLG